MRRPDWRVVALAVGVGVALQLLAVLNPSVAELDPEEMYNAGHAWTLAEGHWDAVWRLQYREFCGGCTGAALLGAPLFVALPATWLTWKLVPIGLSALLCAVGMTALWRRSGAAAALAFGVVCALSPRAWTHLSLIAWGNHVEVGIFSVVAVALALREERWSALLTGLVLGLALWWSFSALALVAAVLGWLLWTGRRRRALLALTMVPVGLSPWVLRYLDTGLHPFVTIYEPGEAAPRLTRVPAKLWTLLAPRQLVALFGHPAPGLGWATGWAFAMGLGGATVVALRKRLPLSSLALAVVAVWTGVYLLVRFQLDAPPAPAIAGPGSVRYFGAVYPLLFVVLAESFGHLWSTRRRLALAMALLILPSGLWTRAEALSAPFPRPALASRRPVDWFQFTPQFAYTLTAAEHASHLPAAEPVFSSLHSEALGWRAAVETLERGAPLLPLPPGGAPVAYGRGVGQALVQVHPPQTPPLLRELAALDRHLDALELGVAETRAAREEAAWLLVRREASWLPPQVQLDDRALQAAGAALAGTPRGVQDAAWHATGRAWATRTTGPGVPSRLVVPPGDWPRAFWRGLGEGAGEEWGPHAAMPTPQGQVDEDAFLEGILRGWSRSWRGPFPAPALAN